MVRMVGVRMVIVRLMWVVRMVLVRLVRVRMVSVWLMWVVRMVAMRLVHMGWWRRRRR